MKFFLDTGNVEEVRRAAELGVLDGVTTNPTLLAKENKPFREALVEMCGLVDIVNGEVVAGAYFVSPFLGRLDDIGQDGMRLLREIMEVYRPYNFETQVLAASLRHPMHVIEAAKLGAHIATMPYKVFEQLFKHPLTDKGLDAFLKDWEKARAVLGDILPVEARLAVGQAGKNKK